MISTVPIGPEIGLETQHQRTKFCKPEGHWLPWSTTRVILTNKKGYPGADLKLILARGGKIHYLG
jgi:hypothetical protein